MSLTDLIRSGWWVLVAAILVSLVVVVAFLSSSGGPASPPDTVVFDLESCLVDRDALVTAMARDGLKALTLPATITPAEIDRRNEEEHGKLLVTSDLVVGVVFGGVARAYPLRLLRWHEAVNDLVGGRAVAVTYSPLSGSVAVWDRSLGGRELELGVSGLLFNSNTVLYDRRDDALGSSLWHQLSGEAIAGPAAGRRLEPLPAALQTWADWRQRHPSTTVMAPDPESERLYKRDPYHSYRGSNLLRFPVDPLPPEGNLARKDLVAVVTVGGKNAVFALPYLATAVGSRRGEWATLLDAKTYVISFDAELGTAAVETHDSDQPAPPVRFSYWFEWYSLHPDTAPLP